MAVDVAAVALVALSSVATLVILFTDGLGDLILQVQEGALPAVWWYVACLDVAVTAQVLLTVRRADAPSWAWVSSAIISGTCGIVSAVYAALLAGIFVLGMRGWEDLVFFLWALLVCIGPMLVSFSAAVYARRESTRSLSHRSTVTVLIAGALGVAVTVSLVGARVMSPVW